VSQYRCPLGALVPSKPDPEQIKREGWREQSILVVSADDHRLDFFQREFVKQIGEKLNGSKRDR
jgi:hypothetical protein